MLLDFNNSKTIKKMPKKKIQHKGKPKHATEETEEAAFRKNVSEDPEEEYTTVTDFELNKKYSKRLIASNWSKYEANLSDFNCDNEEDELPKTDDFNYLLKTASSDCSHFQFNSEKLWKSEDYSIPASKIFDLDISVLSAGLACVPFYERLGLDEKELPAGDKEKFNKEAENSWKHYNTVWEKSLKKYENDSKVKNSKTDSQTLEETLKVKLDLGENSEINEKKSSIVQDLGNESLSTVEIDVPDKNDSVDNKIVNKNKPKFFGENDENLEDWLDSVLDD